MTFCKDEDMEYYAISLWTSNFCWIDMSNKNFINEFYRLVIKFIYQINTRRNL